MIVNIVRLIVLILAVFGLYSFIKDIQSLVKYKHPVLQDDETFISTKVSLCFYTLYLVTTAVFAIFIFAYLYESIVHGRSYYEFMENKPLAVLLIVGSNFSKRLFDKKYLKKTKIELEEVR